MSPATTLTEEQIARHKEAFAALDDDGDGLITRDDLVAFLRHMDNGPGEAELDRIVGEADPEGRGVLDYAAFVSALTYQMRYDDLVAEIRNIFSMLDGDKDGFITANEFRRMMPIVNESASAKEIEEMLSAADADSDGAGKNHPERNMECLLIA